MKTIVYLSIIISLTSCYNSKVKKLYEAREHYLLCNYKEANEIYEDLYNEKWANFVNIELAQTAYKSGEFSKAIRLYKSALSISTDTDFVSSIHYNLGICYAANNQKKEAIKNFKKSIKLYPTKAAKHNLLLLKIENEQVTRTKSDIKETHQNDKPITIRQLNNSTLKEIKIEKKLDDLSKMDAQSKKNAYSKISPTSTVTEKKDW